MLLSTSEVADEQDFRSTKVQRKVEEENKKYKPVESFRDSSKDVFKDG